jgi:(S)-sulfolactate dehydrogenase
MPEVLITEFMNQSAVDDLAGDFDVHYDPELYADPSRLAGLLGATRGLIVRNKTRVDATLLAAGPQLVVVGRLGVGLDNIDVEACAARDVAVCPAVGANAESVAEYVIGALIALLRPALRHTPRMLEGEWSRQESVGSEIAGKRLGLVGLGGIARLVAIKAAALGMAVSAHDPLLPGHDPAWDLAESATLQELLSESDAISLHIPLVKSTRHLIDGAALDRMKPGAVLINTARGGIVDEPALAAALERGAIGGAALDVFEEEPISSRVRAAFAGAPNLILTPHIAGLSAESQERVSSVTAASVRRVLQDRPA